MSEISELLVNKPTEVKECLSNFMHMIEEWQSLIPGTPDEGDLMSLDFIYETAEIRAQVPIKRMPRAT